MAVFPFLSEPDSARRALAIESLTLNGKALDARVSTAVKDIPYERNIDGASTVQLVLVDPDGDLLDSGLFSAAVDIELPAPSAITLDGGLLPTGSDDPLGFRLVRIRTSGATLTLDFEDREVAFMRAHKAVVHASRLDMTRAQFIRSLVRSVGRGQLGFWSPELKVKQPIESIRDQPSKQTKQTRRSPGFGSATVTVKGVEADKAQRRLLEAALDAALSKNANRRVLVGLVAAMTQESVVQNDAGNVAGITGGHRENVGVLHQDERYWPASRDVARDVAPFVDRLITVEKGNRGKSIGWCVDQVQRSYTVGTIVQGRDYDQWVREAGATVSAYNGDASTAGDLAAPTNYAKRYEFRTTEPGADTREDWWSATGRLASEVNFRRFIDYGVFHYVSDDYLLRAAPRLTIDRRKLPDGVANVDIGDFDTGKPRRTQQGKNVGGAEVRVEVFTDVLEPPLGGVWVLKGYGPCDGRYLITSVRGSYLQPRATVTLNLPVPKLAEPAPEVGQRARSNVVDPGAKKVKGEDLAYPLAIYGTFLGGVADHGRRAFGNWQSDNAVDIGCPVGTRVYAVDDGKITRLGGAYDGTGNANPNGYNVTIQTSTYTWFYTHLSQRKPLSVGDTVTRGQLLGHSGAANGVAHLHIASGNHAGTAASGDPDAILRVRDNAGRSSNAPVGKPNQDP